MRRDRSASLARCASVTRLVRLAAAALALVVTACTPVDMSSRSAATVIRAEQTLRVAAGRLAALDRSRRAASVKRPPRARAAS
jgi:hypothetical protein